MVALIRPTTATSTASGLLPQTASTDFARSSEHALIARCKGGDPGAWNSLIRRYEKPVYKFAYSMCHNHEETGDIVSGVFLRLYQNLHTFRHESSLTSWLFLIVRNVYLDQCVRPAYRGNLSLNARIRGAEGDFAGFEITDPAPSPEAAYIEKESARSLATAIHHLPAYQRQALKMYFAQEKTYQEIATATGVSIGTVKSRVHRARKMLCKRLASQQNVRMAI